MDEDALVPVTFHPVHEGDDVGVGGVVEVHGDVVMFHAERASEVGFVGEGAVGGGECEVEDGVEAGIAEELELFGGGLPGGGEALVNGAEGANG